MVFRKDKQFLLHRWHLSCYFCYKPSDKSWIGKGPDCDYDKWNIVMVICDTYTDPSKCINAQYSQVGHRVLSDMKRVSLLKLSDKIVPGRSESESLHSQIVKL
jgi:hypothetical protein